MGLAYKIDGRKTTGIGNVERNCAKTYYRRDIWTLLEQDSMLTVTLFRKWP